jgi:hypothetical protein
MKYVQHMIGADEVADAQKIANDGFETLPLVIKEVMTI